MAQKRMFDRSILSTDDFMDLSMSSKALYFLLGMEADDEGFVSPRKVLRIYGGNDDDIRTLIAKGFIIPFKSGVVVITNWNENNYLNQTRIRPTRYEAERKTLLLTDKGKYVLNNGLTDVKQRLNESRVEESRIEEREQAATGVANDVAKIIKSFEAVDPKNKTYYGNKTQRKAVEFLLKEYGFDQVTKVIALLPKSNQLDYCPIVTSPYELKEKWGKLSASLGKLKNKQPIIL